MAFYFMFFPWSSIVSVISVSQIFIFSSCFFCRAYLIQLQFTSFQICAGKLANVQRKGRTLQQQLKIYRDELNEALDRATIALIRSANHALGHALKQIELPFLQNVEELSVQGNNISLQWPYKSDKVKSLSIIVLFYFACGF